MKIKYSIKTAHSAGFCFGVRRAIQLAEITAKKNGSVYTLGPLIHNPQEVKRLESENIKAVNTPWKLKNETLIIRTHGIPEEFGKKLEKTNLKLVDATCPFVKRAQDIVKQLVKENNNVVIVGDETHPEVVGLISYSNGKGCVISKLPDLKKLRLSGKLGVLSQTTQSPEAFNEIVKKIKKINPRVKVFNTICKATISRQTDAQKTAGNSDVMIIIGGKNSGNTKRLFEISQKYTKAYHIETAAGLKPEWLKGAKTIGLTAGASTPGWIIKDVENKIKYIKEKEQQWK